MNIGEQSRRAAIGRSQTQIVKDALRIDLPPDTVEGQERTDLRGHREAIGCFRPVERLDAERIASHEQLARGMIEDDEGEHADQARQDRGTPLGPPLEQNLGVAVRTESTAQRFKFGAQLKIIVDFPVENDGMGTVLRLHGLPAVGADIDDR